MKWKTAWSYLSIEYNTAIGTIENITQRTCILNNLDSSRIKVKFSNRYSPNSLILEKVVAGKRDENGNKQTETVQITHNGQNRIVLEPFEEFYSDEVSFSAEAGTWIEISIYVKEKTEIRSACSTWSAKSWKTVYATGGDHTEQDEFCGKESREIYPFVNADVNKANIAFGFSKVCVLTEKQVKTVVLFGDSITHMSYYADALIDRLYPEMPGKVTVVNRGIGGNRILHDATYVKDMPGNGRCFGEAAVKRFEEDVCTGVSADMVIIMEGINDIMHPFVFHYPKEAVTAKQLADGMKQLFDIAQKKGIQVYAGTLMPFRSDEMEWIPEGEKIRKELNKWIKGQNLTVGVVDFAKAVQKEDNPEYMQEDYHIGDGLHPGAKGGIAMAEAIPMSWFAE